MMLLSNTGVLTSTLVLKSILILKLRRQTKCAKKAWECYHLFMKKCSFDHSDEEMFFAQNKRESKNQTVFFCSLKEKCPLIAKSMCTKNHHKTDYEGIVQDSQESPICKEQKSRFLSFSSCSHELCCDCYSKLEQKRCSSCRKDFERKGINKYKRDKIHSPVS
jgi:hypothetical protein